MRASRIFLFGLLLLQAAPVQAWYKHEVLMPWVVSGLSNKVREKLAKAQSAPCEDEDKLTIARLSSELMLNPAGEFPRTAPDACLRGEQISMENILLSGAVDDPDRGMDSDLAISPDQKYLGGTTGPSSQGYRHNYLAGWRLGHPIVTAQWPMYAMGDAHNRAKVMAEKARLFLNEGKPIWAARVMAWALHYVQDLSQPFHTVKLPSLYMIPFFHWSHLETSITNYHWAYEGYVLARFKEALPPSRMSSCMQNPGLYTGIDPAAGQGPWDLAVGVARASVGLASRVGKANVNLFGRELSSPDCELPANKCPPDYQAIFAAQKLEAERRELEEITCRALANAAWASHRLIEWVLR